MRRILRTQLPRDVFVVIAAVFIGLRLAGVEPWVQSVDAYAYWSTRTGDYYAASGVGLIGAYLYSPAFAQFLAPITWLPWQAFVALWTAVNIAALCYLGRGWALLLLLFLPVPFEIISGNVHLLIAVVVVLGFRAPALWAFVVLTKVTPGIGLVWFAVRREWRSLGIALAATAVVVAVSFVLAPGEWPAWIRSLVANAEGPRTTLGWYLPVPLLVRLPLAAVLIAWGGITDRRWILPIAVTLALPVVWLNSLAILVALLPILREGRTAVSAPAGGAESGPGLPVSVP